MYNKNKEIRWIEISPSIVYDEKGKPTFTQGVLRDITERLTIQKEKEVLLKNLKKSNQELNDFAHVVSHDLKAPLRSMNALVAKGKSNKIATCAKTATTFFSAPNATTKDTNSKVYTQTPIKNITF